MWDYRYDRAGEVWDHARDYYDNYFDDHWWGRCRWGYGYGYVGFGTYPANPWWWWAPAAWNGLTNFIHALTPTPVYVDYGTSVIYEGDTVYVNGGTVPIAEYSEPAVEMATTTEQAPPPAPPEQGQQAEWMPLGVFALVQEEKGDPVLLFQLSINRDGVISGAYQSAITDDQRPVSGRIDKKTQQAAWRIGENMDTVFATTLANLTLDASPVQIYFSGNRTQTWLLVRIPEPADAKAGSKPPQIKRTVPPANPPVKSQ